MAFNTLKEAVTLPLLWTSQIQESLLGCRSLNRWDPLRMLGQMERAILQPVAYPLKQVDEVAKGWTACLQE